MSKFLGHFERSSKRHPPELCQAEQARAPLCSDDSDGDDSGAPLCPDDSDGDDSGDISQLRKSLTNF